jgi:hypothetical protein
MSMHLRTAIEKLKDHYINHLIKSGFTEETKGDLKRLTITELKTLTNDFSK